MKTDAKEEEPGTSGSGSKTPQGVKVCFRNDSTTVTIWLYLYFVLSSTKVLHPFISTRIVLLGILNSEFLYKFHHVVIMILG